MINQLEDNGILVKPKKASKVSERKSNDSTKKGKVGKVFEKKSAVQPWLDIFLPSKIVVSMNPRNFESPELVIRFAQEDFLSTLGYESEDILGMPFDLVLGQASIRLNSYRLQTAILLGKSCCEYNNLYRRDGVMLSCHLTVQSINGSPSESTSSRREKWAVITIRSASVVGNSVQSGVGLLGIDRIPQATLEKSVPTNPKKQ